MRKVNVSIAEAKKRFSEFVARTAYSGDRVVITKRSRPVAALVGLEDFRDLEQQGKRAGLASLAGRWKGFEDIEREVRRVVRARGKGGAGRRVSL